MSGVKFSKNRSYRDAHSVVEEEVVVKTLVTKSKKKKEKVSKIKKFFNSLFKR